jgi:hypothetical protein
MTAGWETVARRSPQSFRGHHPFPIASRLGSPLTA